MKYVLGAVASLIACAQAVQFTNSNFAVSSGQPFTLTWSGATGPVTITLKNGPTSDLKTVVVIDSNDSSQSFTWTPPADLASGNYAFEISDGSGTPNFSQDFAYQGNPTGTLGLTGQSAVASSTTGSASATGSSTTAATTGTSTGSSSSASGTTTATKSSSSAATTTSTSASSSASSSTTTKAPANSNDSKRLASPLAFILVTVAALVYFN